MFERRECEFVPLLSFSQGNTAVKATHKKLPAEFASNTQGSVAIIFGLILVAMCGMIALAVDYGRGTRAKTVATQAIDAALTGGVKAARDTLMGGKSKDEAAGHGVEIAKTLFADEIAKYPELPASGFDPQINFVNGEVVGNSGPLKTSLKTTFAKIMGINELDIVVENEARIGLGKWTELHFLVDLSASMGVGATDNDISIMANTLGCAFACHVPPDYSFTGWWTTTHRARNAGATLRIDVMKNAIRDVVEKIKSYGSNRIKIAIHGFSNNLLTLQPVTTDYDAVLSAVDKIDIVGEWGQGGTTYHTSFAEAAAAIGSSNDGETEMTSRKTLLLFTDGIATNLLYGKDTRSQTQVDPNFTYFLPVYNGWGAWSIQGFDPAACNPFKDKKIETFVIYSEYAYPKEGIGSDTRFKTVNTFIKDPAKANLETCATGSGHFFSASTPDQIEPALHLIYEQAVAASLRITK